MSPDTHQIEAIVQETGPRRSTDPKQKDKEDKKISKKKIKHSQRCLDKYSNIYETSSQKYQKVTAGSQ